MSQFLQGFELWSETWLAGLWRASWHGAIAIAAVWAITRRSRFLSARVACWFWRLACVKLLVALFWVQPVWLRVLAAESAAPVVPEAVSLDVADPVAGQPRGQPVEQLNVGTPAMPKRSGSGPFWGRVLFLLWLAGGAVSLGGVARPWLSARSLVASAMPPVSDLTIEACRREAKRLGVRRLPRLLLSLQVDSPLLAGIWRPAIVLPARLEAFDAHELRLMLAHELAHHRRRDLAWNWLPTIARVIFFFHPLVWLLVRRWSESQEAACDELLIQKRLTYPVEFGHLLLKLAAREPLPTRSALTTACVLGAFHNLERRVTAMSCVRPYSLRRLVIAVSVVALIVVSGLIPWRLAPRTAVADEAEPAGTPAPAARSLDIVIAEHVILWDGRIRTWNEVVAELREIRQAKGEPIHPHFHFTNGAHSAGYFDTYKAKTWEVYRELFEPAGMSLASISPRAGPRYDAIRKAQDLIPDPATMRSGIVVEEGKPRAGVSVVLVPEAGVMPVMLKPDLTLRDALDEVWTVTGPDGRFTLPVPPAQAADDLAAEKTAEPGARPRPVVRYNREDDLAAEKKAERAYSLAAISRTGYGLASLPAEGKEATIELQPPAYVQLTPVEGEEQRIDLSLGGGLSDTSPGFSIYEIQLQDEPLLLRLPPGKTTVRRAFRHLDGGSRAYPAETVQLRPGASRKITLPNIVEEEAEQKWREGSLRAKSDAEVILDLSRVRTTAPGVFFLDAVADDQPAPVKQTKLTHSGSWTVTDPGKDCNVSLTGDKLSITVPATNHDLCPARGLNAPRVLRKVNGDFVVQVKLTADFKPGTTSTGIGQPFNGAGILLWHNEEDFVRVERNAFWIGETLYCYPPIMEYWHNGKYSGANNNLIQADYFKGRSTWLKATRQGTNVAVSISHDGKQWSDVKTFPVEMADELFVGVAALNTSDTPFTVDFEELTIESK
jgi:beta-lactamase regulating signal transducer with metallopeptidase domain/regulation of enolase protein 1 (concanavalin A-like superfamily)